MIQSSRHSVLLLSGEERIPFDPAELREELVRCFLSSGMEESCYMASDIVLAVEYALEHAGRPENLFSRAELDDMVVRILENTGFAEVSRQYRNGTPASVRVRCQTDPRSVETVLRRYFAGPEGHLQMLSEQVASALKVLHAGDAAPELMVELARHYEAFVPSDPLPLPVNARPADEHYILTPDEVRTVSAEPLAGLGDVCRIHGIGRLFPNIRFSFFLRRFAVQCRWDPPVLEMMLLPYLVSAGKKMDACRRSILQLYRETAGNPRAELPFYITLPDMDDFLGEYLQMTPEGMPQARSVLTDMLASGIGGPVEKIRFAE